jgi:hypothetical protein
MVKGTRVPLGNFAQAPRAAARNILPGLTISRRCRRADSREALRQNSAMASAYQGPPERLARYERLIEGTPGVERKGATMPYTSRNGHMFSFLDATGVMALRLPPDTCAEFISQYSSTLVVQHGRTMQEYVVVPNDLLERTDELRLWMARSHEWIGTLKPKSTTASKKG